MEPRPLEGSVSVHPDHHLAGRNGRPTSSRIATSVEIYRSHFDRSGRESVDTDADRCVPTDHERRDHGNSARGDAAAQSRGRLSRAGGCSMVSPWGVSTYDGSLGMLSDLERLPPGHLLRWPRPSLRIPGADWLLGITVEGAGPSTTNRRSGYDFASFGEPIQSKPQRPADPLSRSS